MEADSSSPVDAGSVHVKFNDVVDEQLYEARGNEDQYQNLDYFANAYVSKEDLMQIAEEVIGEKPNWTYQDLQALRDLLQQYSEKLADDLSDEQLLKFLRAKCFDYEVAAQTIKNYHQLIRTRHDTMCQSLTKLSEVFSDNLLHVLPYLDSKYALTLIVCGDQSVTGKHTYQQLISALFYTLERMLNYEIPQVAGVNVIINLHGITFSHLKQIKPLLAKCLAYMVEECLPIRINVVHVAGPRMLSHLAYAIIKPFLSQLMRSKIEFMSNERLLKVYPVTLLPKQLGGKQESLNSERWYLELLREENVITSQWNIFKMASISAEAELGCGEPPQGTCDRRSSLSEKKPNCSQRNSSFPILNILPACTEYLSPFYK